MARALRAAIDAGMLAEGDRLPSERQLAVMSGVARNTAREAIRQLAEAGLVTAEHGRGVFVRRKPRLLRFGQLRYSRRLRDQTGLSAFHAEVQARGQVPNVVPTGSERVVPPEHVADRLEISPAAESVVRLESRYFVDDEPVQIAVTYIPCELADGFVPAGDGPGELDGRLEARGQPIARAREEITARMPTPDEVTGLRVPEGVPVLILLHTGVDGDGKPLEVTEFTMRADYVGLDYTMPVDE